MRELKHDPDHVWEKSTVIDQEAIDHERQIGEVEVVGGDVVRVRVAQRIDFDLLADPVGSRVSPPRITFGEMFELTPAQAAELGDDLHEAAAFAERIGAGPRQPQLVSEIRLRQLLPRPGARPAQG